MGTGVHVAVFIVGEGFINNFVGAVVIVTFCEAEVSPVAVATKIPV